MPINAVNPSTITTSTGVEIVCDKVLLQELRIDRNVRISLARFCELPNGGIVDTGSVKILTPTEVASEAVQTFITSVVGMVKTYAEAKNLVSLPEGATLALMELRLMGRITQTTPATAQFVMTVAAMSGGDVGRQLSSKTVIFNNVFVSAASDASLASLVVDFLTAFATMNATGQFA
jgi:hypothetical protein